MMNTEMSKRNWKWERGDWGRVFQGARLGDLPIVLESTYVRCEEDCGYIERALEKYPELLKEIARLNRELADLRKHIGEHALIRSN